MSKTTLFDSRIKKYAYREAAQIYKEIGVSPDGLSREQVEEMREQYGANSFAERKNDTMVCRLRRAFINPFNVILFILEIISLVTDVLIASDFARNASTAIIIFTMILISGAIRLVQELRAKNAAQQLDRLIHESITVRRGGELIEIPAEKLVVGDIVLLSAGDRVPADIRLTSVTDLFISQAAITGESAILEKTCRTLSYSSPETLTQLENLVFMATTVISGKGEGIVLAVGKDTLYGSFAKPESEDKKSFQRGANSIAWVMLRFIAVLIPSVFVLLGVTGGNWLESFAFALSVAVGLMPEMLPMVITACLARGSLSMSRKQTILKDINAMQGFGSMDVLCMDKTGTLTNESILLEYYMDVLGNESGKVLDFAFLNSYFQTGYKNLMDFAIIHKTEEAEAEDPRLLDLSENYVKVDEIPFDFTRRRLTTVVQDKKGKTQMVTKGAVEEMLSICSYAECDGTVQPLTAEIRKRILDTVDDLNDKGFRVLAIAQKSNPSPVGAFGVKDECEMVLLSYLAFLDPPKESTADAIKALKAHGVNTKILTGDNDKVTRTICKQVGLKVRNMLLGSDLDNMTDAELARAAESTDVFAKLTPDQKSRVVSVLRENGHTVGFMGDGINDAAAMKAADIGISVDTAVDVAKKSADIILLEKDLMVLEQGIIEGRKTYANMIKYIKMTASSNFGNMFSVLAASALLPFLPMMSVHLIFLNLIYDLSCTAIPWDNVDEEFIATPRKWDASSVGSFMIWIGPTSSILDFTTYIFMYFVFCPLFVSGGVLFNDLAAHYSGAELAAMQARYIGMFQAGCFVESMWSQTLVIHMIRTPKIPFIQSHASAPVTLLTMTGIGVLTVIPFTPLGTALGFTALPAMYFAYLIPCILLYMVLATSLKKDYVRHYGELL